jgi:NifU-like protein involved in Fe-S cluster formation
MADDIADDDALMLLYNRELIALSSQVAAPRCLNSPDVKATAVSAVCGSEVTVELCLKGETIQDFGYAVEACTLTKAVVAVMAKAAPGKDRAEIAAAGKALQAMMAGTAPPPSGEWADLKILTPVIGYKSRHDTIMLPFEAVEKAFAQKK